MYRAGEHSIATNRLDEAAWCFERAAMLDPASPRPLRGLAQTRQLQGRPAEARSLIKQAIARGTDNAENHKILGQICQSAGDFPAAIAAFQQAIALDPANGHAQLRLALLASPPDPAARAAEIEQVLARPALDIEQRATLTFALARTLEGAGDPDRTFAAYRAANDIRHAQYPGYTDSFSSADPLISLFTPDFLAARAGLGLPTEAPIFIVGMMRSGTTLIEQILASHPAVHGHGELSDIRQIAHAIAGEYAAAGSYPVCLAALTQARARALGQRYLAGLARQAPDAARHLDKLPHNFENLGLIALLFPRARIIHCTRDPLDTCLANYFQDYGHTNPATYDLATLGRYWREYHRLMDHWSMVLPNPILHLPYEELVQDQEGWTRRAVAFADLPWNESCLAFHANPRPVFTKSLWQVRQPIYRTSVGRAQRYRAHLEPLLAALSGEK